MPWGVQKEGGGLSLPHKQRLTSLVWHARGDYFATVAPAGNTQVHPIPRVSSLHSLRARRPSSCSSEPSAQAKKPLPIPPGTKGSLTYHHVSEAA